MFNFNKSVYRTPLVATSLLPKVSANARVGGNARGGSNGSPAKKKKKKKFGRSTTQLANY